MDVPRASEVLRYIMVIQHLNFARFMQSLLDDRQSNQEDCAKSDLYEYLLDQGFEIEKTSMYRYFNSQAKTNRMPSKGFLTLFANFLKLPLPEREALFALWEQKARERRRSAGKKVAQKVQSAA